MTTAKTMLKEKCMVVNILNKKERNSKSTTYLYTLRNQEKKKAIPKLVEGRKMFIKKHVQRTHKAKWGED